MNRKTLTKTAMATTAGVTVRGAYLPVLAVVLTMLSCITGTEPTSYDRDALVVQGYLYAGRPVSDIRVMHLTKAIRDTIIPVERRNEFTNTIDTIDTMVTLVNDSFVDNAQVTISSNGQSHGLVYRDSGWYMETSGNLVITEGQTCRLDIVADGRHAWAETTVPSKVGGLRTSRDTMYIPGEPAGSMLPTLPSGDLGTLTLQWNNPDGVIFFCKFILDSEGADYGLWHGQYTDTDSFSVQINYTSADPFIDFSPGVVGIRTIAKYKFVLYSTTPDYRSMLAEATDSTRQDRWARSPTNINGGLGFFTSFSSDSLSFYFAQWEAGN